MVENLGVGGVQLRLCGDEIACQAVTFALQRADPLVAFVDLAHEVGDGDVLGAHCVATCSHKAGISISAGTPITHDSASAWPSRIICTTLPTSSAMPGSPVRSRVLSSSSSRGVMVVTWAP